ncbi:metal ABC transporter permease [uncultured Helicobacter sp.]|uniref:metal ABC transporter permease n=1 Tax=uncultured Helicobacter sp. TaxID=175537 RepID=UPI003752A334
MIESVFEILGLKFVWMALLVSFLVSIVSGVVGSIAVANKKVFVAGSVAHSAFGGVGLALFCGFSPTLGAMVFAVVLALLLSWADRHYHDRLDSYMGAIWAFGMALGVVFIDFTPGYNSDIASYLFGSIIAVSDDEVLAIAVYDVVLLGFVGVCYKQILGLLYDEAFCRVQGVNSAWLSGVIFVFIAVGVVMSMSVAGLILVLAILSIPAYIAQLFVGSLRAMMFVGFVLSLAFMWVGFFLAYWLNISPGACIVLLMCVGMLIGLGLKLILQKEV